MSFLIWLVESFLLIRLERVKNEVFFIPGVKRVINEGRDKVISTLMTWHTGKIIKQWNITDYAHVQIYALILWSRSCTSCWLEETLHITSPDFYDISFFLLHSVTVEMLHEHEQLKARYKYDIMHSYSRYIQPFYDAFFRAALSFQASPLHPDASLTRAECKDFWRFYSVYKTYLYIFSFPLVPLRLCHTHRP